MIKKVFVLSLLVIIGLVSCRKTGTEPTNINSTTSTTSTTVTSSTTGVLLDSVIKIDLANPERTLKLSSVFSEFPTLGFEASGIRIKDGMAYVACDNLNYILRVQFENPKNHRIDSTHKMVTNMEAIDFYNNFTYISIETFKEKDGIRSSTLYGYQGTNPSQQWNFGHELGITVDNKGAEGICMKNGLLYATFEKQNYLSIFEYVLGNWTLKKKVNYPQPMSDYADIDIEGDKMYILSQEEAKFIAYNFDFSTLEFKPVRSEYSLPSIYTNVEGIDIQADGNGYFCSDNSKNTTSESLFYWKLK